MHIGVMKRKDGPRLESLNKTLFAIYEKITVAEEMMLKFFLQGLLCAVIKT